MLDFFISQYKQTDMGELSKAFTVDGLRQLTEEMIQRQLALIAPCQDEDVVFVPEDPEAHDAYATDASEEALAWTLGHVIVHTTASSEESAYLAVELARGVPYRGGRSRYETPWQSVTTIEQCRQRLEESRRMRLASLDMWPDAPFLENTFETRSGKHYNAMVRFLLGLSHDANHLGQIENIVGQALAARGK